MSFPTIEAVQGFLEEMAEAIPEPFYEGLNLGIILLPETKLHPEGQGDLFILGEYEVSMAGSGITIFYGSFREVFGQASHQKIREELEHTLRHEFWHHMEYRAGEDALERQDEAEMEEYHHQVTSRKGGA